MSRIFNKDKILDLLDNKWHDRFMEDLGMIYPSKNSKKKKHFFLMRCDICSEGVRRTMADIKHKNQSYRHKGCSKVTHGYSKHPLKSVYYSMKARCTKTNHPSYLDYGGRGIKVCDEWSNSITLFIDWCKENGYKKGLTIDRKNNNIGYSPSNCRLISQSDQMINTRSNIKFTQDEMSDMIELYESTKPIKGRIKRGLNFLSNFCIDFGITVPTFNAIKQGKFRIKDNYVYQTA